MVLGEDEADNSNGRAFLVQADHEASRDFDKAVMTLSAGALGLSIAFVDNIAPTPREALSALAAAWGFFATSLLVILISFLTSQKALRYEITLLDLDDDPPARLGGKFGTVTQGLNVSAAGFLVAGVICLIVFAIKNL